MSMSQRSIAVSTTRRPYDSTPFRSHARSDTESFCRQSPEVGAGWFNDHVRICAGGAQQCAFLPQQRGVRRNPYSYRNGGAAGGQLPAATRPLRSLAASSAKRGVSWDRGSTDGRWCAPRARSSSRSRRSTRYVPIPTARRAGAGSGPASITPDPVTACASFASTGSDAHSRSCSKPSRPQSPRHSPGQPRGASRHLVGGRRARVPRLLLRVAER